MPVPGMHRLEFEGGRVTLTLIFSGRDNSNTNADSLSALVLRADALYLTLQTAPTESAKQDRTTFALCKTLGRIADDNATFAAQVNAAQATALRSALAQSGFVCADASPAMSANQTTQARLMLTGQFMPRWRVRRHDPLTPLNVSERHAIVIGAGLAGCALIERLAARGWRITSLERHAEVAQEASGNPAGVFHPMLSRDDNVAARLSRAGFLYARQRWAALVSSGQPLVHDAGGLLQLAENTDEANAIAEMLKTLGYPAAYASAMSRSEAQCLAGLPVMQGGCFFRHGGWIDPTSLCSAQYATAGTQLERHLGVDVSRIAPEGDQWQVFDASGNIVARAPVVIVANAHDAARIAGLRYAPTQSVRGQLTLLPASIAPDTLPHLRIPVIGNGYAVPLAHGVTLTGATYDIDDFDSALRPDSQHENLTRLSRLLPSLTLPACLPEIGGRVAFRCVTSDRLPLCGNLADETLALAHASQLNGAHLADLPRARGLYGAFAFGSRGLIWAALAAELIAAQIEGEPLPVERELADAIDPARFLLRALRQGKVP